VNILRRIPLSRLLLLCTAVVAAGVSASALALAVGSGPVPPAKPLAQAVHDALAGPPVEGVSASITLRNHLLEGANLASEGGEAGPLASSPLLSGASGRLWIAKDGRVRLELQAEKGDTQILYDGHTLQLYDAGTNTLYRYSPPASEHDSAEPPGESPGEHHETPSLAKIEEAIAKISKHANVSGATPTDVAGQPAYRVRISPKEGGSLFAGAEVSFDAVHGVPLRAAVYSTNSSAPVIELAATAISYGPVDDSVFSFTPPPNAKIVEPAGEAHGGSGTSEQGTNRPKVTIHGHGSTGVAVVESHAGSESQGGSSALPQSLPKVSINGTSASELSTPLGTLLSFERSGVRYLVLGSVPAASVEAVARGL
jgi:outer membrane lipoprotein-sorting protein